MKKIRFFLDQYGCAKNQVDGELLISHLKDSGYERISEPELADLIIINSCGFIEAAKKESLNAVITARNAYPNAKIMLAGCLSERYTDDLLDNLDEADAFFGNGDLSKVTQTVSELFEKDGIKPHLLPAQEGVSSGERTDFLSFAGSAYVKITEGCDNHCSFCAIPLIRGKLRSRSIAEIVAEVKSLLDKGIFEINLIGQDLAAYGSDFSLEEAEQIKNPHRSSVLAQLLKEISLIKGTFWVRLLYIHPDHFPFDILPIIASDSRMLPYFDIPFQSGSDVVIARMNRHNSAESYRSTLQKIRSILPEAVLRTTFLVGFPGETDEQFLETKQFLQDIQPHWSGCFTYSKEEDTPAASFKGRVTKKIAENRKNILEDIQSNITNEHLKQYIGKTLDVLLEEFIPGFAIGRAWFQAPEVDGAVVVRLDEESIDNETENEISAKLSQYSAGEVLRVKIIACNGADLEAVLL